MKRKALLSFGTCIICLFVFVTLMLPILTLADSEEIYSDAGTGNKLIYDPLTDSLKAMANVWVIDLKKNAEVTVKSTAKFHTILNGESISLAELKKKNTMKDLYLYYRITDPSMDEAPITVKPNLIISKQTIKRMKVSFDYTKADEAEADSGIIKYTAYDYDNEKIKNVSKLPKIQWSEDKEIWRDESSFNGGTLASYVRTGKNIYIRELGTSELGRYTRTGKAVKVKIAKQAKAPTMLMNAGKNSLARQYNSGLRNGYDFAASNEDGTGVLETNATNSGLKDKYGGKWFTILPYSRNGCASHPIIETRAYMPRDKTASDYNKFSTNVKIKNFYLFAKFVALTSDDNLQTSPLSGPEQYCLGEIYYMDKTDPDDMRYGLVLRKSATTKKPASAIAHVIIEKQAEAPMAEPCYVAETACLLGVEDEFRITFEAIHPAGTFKIENGQYKKEEIRDNHSNDFKYAVVDIADILSDNIDWTTMRWCNLEQGRTKVSGLMWSTYKQLGSKKKKRVYLKAVPDDGNAPDQDTLTENNNSLEDLQSIGATSILIIRRNGGPGVISSKYGCYFVQKDIQTVRTIDKATKTNPEPGITQKKKNVYKLYSLSYFDVVSAQRIRLTGDSLKYAKVVQDDDGNDSNIHIIADGKFTITEVTWTENRTYGIADGSFQEDTVEYSKLDSITGSGVAYSLEDVTNSIIKPGCTYRVKRIEPPPSF